MIKPNYTLQDEKVYEVSSQEEARQFAEKLYSENKHAFEKFGITWEILESFKNNITAEGVYLNRLSDIPVKVDKE